jgi:hypothetical protein
MAHPIIIVMLCTACLHSAAAAINADLALVDELLWREQRPADDT